MRERRVSCASLALIVLLWAGCTEGDSGSAPTASPTAQPATITATPAPTDGSPAMTPTPQLVDYAPMEAQIVDYLRYTARRFGYDLGIAFVDVQTMQEISIDGDLRYHAMSSFKGPLAAYYFWLVERGQIEEQPGDIEHLRLMLEVSYNISTTCIFKRVGGIAAFNDWLAEQGFNRENNFVLKWQDWPCRDDEEYYIPPIDLRYTQGDPELGLPGDGVLLRCPIAQLPCDKAHSPLDLARFYARLYRGEVLDQQHTALLLSLMEEPSGESVFLNHLPRDADVSAYVKGGTHESDEIYRVNFFSEAGVVETPQGAFALAIFMQRNPEWPGTESMSEVAQIITEYFMAVYGAQP